MENKPKGNLKVFIVEDSERISNWMRATLEELEGISVKEVGGNVEVVKEKIQKNKPDVVILDLRLSDGSGMEILKSIYTKKLDIKVIVFTNYPWQVFQKQCMNMGANYFFDKMQDSEKLTEAIQEIQLNYNGDSIIKSLNSFMI